MLTPRSATRVALLAVLALGSAVLSGCGGSAVVATAAPPTTPAPTPVPPTQPTATPVPDTRADAMLAQMTQAEKLAMVHGAVPSDDLTGATVPLGAAGWVPGNTRLNIPTLYLADGSNGAGNKLGPATALPSSLASAASWDLNEAAKYGDVIGTELADYGANLNLGGNVNLIGRDPRDGRAFETKGEDPILAGRITAAHIRAIQAHHVIGGIKHFAFNDQETGRTRDNFIVDERSARETDLLAFEIGIKDSDAQTVMCAYGLTNGQYDCENSHLLNDILKRDWGFPGFVLTDWRAARTTATAANNGLDQEQPDAKNFSSLGTAIDSGQVAQSRLDNMVHRILRAMYAVGIFDNAQQIQPIPAAADAAIAQEVEENGAVLLKNANNQLPLNAASLQSIAVIGLKADLAVLAGSGSAGVQPTGGYIGGGTPCPPCWSHIVWDRSSPLKAIKAMAPNATVQFADGSDAAAAAALAARAQAAIVFVTQWASEGMDQTILALHDYTSDTPVDQDALVSAVAAANPHTVVVIESGGPILMPWLGRVNAVLEAWYPGQSGAPAIANLLFGVANPSGKLPVTFPASDNQLPRPIVPTPPSGIAPFDIPLTEGLEVGYKWYDANQLTPLFPFGFGLSYTTFRISSPSLVDNLGSSANPNVQVTFTLQNTGNAAGAEVPQVYLQFPGYLNEPPKRLVGWRKVSLQPGASSTVSIEIDQNDSAHPLSYWDTASGQWKVGSGTYAVLLGTSSSASTLQTVGSFNVP